jgi:hypothetical protein
LQADFRRIDHLRIDNVGIIVKGGMYSVEEYCCLTNAGGVMVVINGGGARNGITNEGGGI